MLGDDPMLRDLRPEDIETLVRMLRAGDHTPEEAVRRAIGAYRVLLCEEDGRIMGFVGTREEKQGRPAAETTPRELDLRVYVDPGFRRQGLGRLLYGAGMARLRGPGRVTARYRADDPAPTGGPNVARAFYARRGFEVWYSMEELVYHGGRRERGARARPLAGAGARPAALAGTHLDIRPYDDRYFERYIRIVGDAFEPMRRGKDFRPHNVLEMNDNPERRAYFLSAKSDIFLALAMGSGGEETLVGVGGVQGDFIDEVGVDPAHQGRGYGKALIEFGVNLLLERGFPSPRTSVVSDNEPARGMYYRLGFELVQVDEWARKNHSGK
jgi:GNAT superfamily N-acetyltransferase